MTDVFRQNYRPITDEVKILMTSIKEQAQTLHDSLDSLGDSFVHDKRMMALAKTNLEQAIMWAVKSIT